MTSDAGDALALPDDDLRRDVLVLVATVALTIVLSRVVLTTIASDDVPVELRSAGSLVAETLAVWGVQLVPLALGAAWVLRRRSTPRALRVSTRRLGLGLREAVAAVGIVLVSRTVESALTELLFHDGVGLDYAVPPLFATRGIAVAAVIGGVAVFGLRPVVEEVVFRGLLQRRLAAVLPHRAWFLAVVISAFAFAVERAVVTFPSPAGSDPFLTFSTALVFGALTGSLVTLTGRIGGAMVANVLFALPIAVNL